jgi:hypothetical protein
MTLHNLRDLFTVDMHNHGETSVYLLWKLQKSSKLGDSGMKLMPHSLSQINKGPPLQVIVFLKFLEHFLLLTNQTDTWFN